MPNLCHHAKAEVLIALLSLFTYGLDIKVMSNVDISKTIFLQNFKSMQGWEHAWRW